MKVMRINQQSGSSTALAVPEHTSYFVIKPEFEDRPGLISKWQFGISMPHRKERDKSEPGELCLYTADKRLEIEVLSVTYVYIIL
jgi:hypothetical protein